MLLRSTAPHINKYSFHNEKKTKRSKENVLNQKSLGSAANFHRETKKNLFFMRTDLPCA